MVVGATENCNRCGEVLKTGSWEETTYFNSGELKVMFSGTMANYILPCANDCGDAEKVIESSGLSSGDELGAQETTLRWGGKKPKYILCRKCQALFLKTVGDFFLGGAYDNWVKHRRERVYTAKSLNALDWINSGLRKLKEKF